MVSLVSPKYPDISWEVQDTCYHNINNNCKHLVPPKNFLPFKMTLYNKIRNFSLGGHGGHPDRSWDTRTPVFWNFCYDQFTLVYEAAILVSTKWDCCKLRIPA